MWSRKFSDTTRGKLVAVLRRGSFTVEELARELGVTDNAVRAQLASLERDGLVRQEGLRRAGRKPSALYGLSEEFETTLSQAYIPLLIRLLRELGRTIPEGELVKTLRSIGRQWAQELPRGAARSRSKAEAASALLNELGGVTRVEEVDGRAVVRGFSCPLAAAVQENPNICLAVEALLSELLESDVRECCDRSAHGSRCCFQVPGEDRSSHLSTL